jgi:hypothetical protein
MHVNASRTASRACALPGRSRAQRLARRPMRNKRACRNARNVRHLASVHVVVARALRSLRTAGRFARMSSRSFKICVLLDVGIRLWQSPLQ